MRPERLADGLWSVCSRLFTVHSGILVDGRSACLIDPGLLPGEIDDLAAFVASKRAEIQCVLLTHAHWDHILGPERLPGMPAIGHADFPQSAGDSRGVRVVAQTDRWFREQGIERDRPFEMPRLDRVFRSKLDLKIGRRTVRLVHAPGHSADHFVVHIESLDTLWAADMLSDQEIPYVCHSLSAFEDTLATLSKLDISMLIPAHGAPAADRQSICERFRADQAYLGELRCRVERAVRDGCTVEEAHEACRSMRFPAPDANRRAHQLNTEHVYCELGGAADARQMGWNRLHLS